MPKPLYALPPPELSRKAQWKQPLVQAIEGREVRSEAELRQALAEIKAETPLTVYGDAGYHADLYTRALIVIASPFEITDTVTIDVPGVEIASRGYTPLIVVGGLDIVFDIRAALVSMVGLSQTTPQGSTPPLTFARLYNADSFSISGCFVGGSSYFLDTDPSSSAMSLLSVSACVTEGDTRIKASRSSFAGSPLGNVTLQDPSRYNRFAGCEIGDITILGTTSSHNVFSGCNIDGSCDDSACTVSGYNNINGNSGTPTVASWTGVGSLAANNT